MRRCVHSRSIYYSDSKPLGSSRSLQLSQSIEVGHWPEGRGRGRRVGVDRLNLKFGVAHYFNHLGYRTKVVLYVYKSAWVSSRVKIAPEGAGKK